MRKLLLLACMLLCFACKKTKQNSQGEDFSNNVNKVSQTIIDDSAHLTFFSRHPQAIAPSFEQFPSGSVLPKGWILEMMKNDLNKGMVGALDDLYPGIQKDDLYNTARRGGMEDIPEMGDLVLTGAAWEKSIMWWNAETIGNWWDGFIRHAFLTNNTQAIEQSHKIIKNLLASQDKDGYIGIYKPNLRYQHEGSNGELWAQTTAFRTMLAYHEFTKDQKVLEAVEKAMKVTMHRYGEKGKNPFYLKNAFGGVTHGLMLTDVCETLYRITGDTQYQDYATYLYKAFSTFSINRSFNDLRFPYLIQKDSLFEGHAVHTYEHIRTLANAYYNTGYEELKSALQIMQEKLAPCLLPSGAGHGNEWIAKLIAHPEHTSSEYCSMLELRNSFGSLLQKTGEIDFADAAEKLTYNAMLGFRNREGTALTYGKADNCYVLDGHHHQNGESREDPRYKYSPTHSEPAVCCVPNYGRNFTYFLEQMWMKKKEGIAALMFGPSRLETTLKNTNISISQETKYPMSDVITFSFQLERPATFPFYIRIPQWSSGIEENTNSGKVKDGYYIITRTWKDGDRITIRFKNEAQVKVANNDELYIQRGPLVYAYEIPHKEETIKSYGMGFKDYYCLPKNTEYKDLILAGPLNATWRTEASGNSFYDANIFVDVDFINKRTNKKQTERLVPIGNTILRRTTFPKQ